MSFIKARVDTVEVIRRCPSAYDTWLCAATHPAKYCSPNTFEDLNLGIRAMSEWIQSFTTAGTLHHNAAIRWICDAQNLLSFPAPVTLAPDLQPTTGSPMWIDRKHYIPDQTKLPPQICRLCNFKNDYAGQEHLSADGTYTCRSCK